ncbi:MAG TPA: MATE family efflux transporter, partial [Candidatus Scatavimonas merdigallinarum]|nr:MATE family efflux transporter [Candidatus Scatavimonas merdigallinarum]
MKRNGNIINKKYLEYFIPTVLTAMANNIAVMVDSILVGHMVGSTSMAAINLLSPVIQFYFSMTILFGLGASTIISYAKGKNDKA